MNNFNEWIHSPTYFIEPNCVGIVLLLSSTFGSFIYHYLSSCSCACVVDRFKSLVLSLIRVLWCHVISFGIQSNLHCDPLFHPSMTKVVEKKILTLKFPLLTWIFNNQFSLKCITSFSVINQHKITLLSFEYFCIIKLIACCKKL
jgi:hypothetical protein